jgi:hypothetical protein
MNPFEYLNSINHKKNNLMVDEDTEKGYAPFMVNRGLSYFQDTVLFANEMNTRSHIDNKLQYDFLREGIRSKKRFSKWIKKTSPASIETIKEYYGYSDAKAEAIVDMVSPEDLKAMKKHLSKGGKR